MDKCPQCGARNSAWHHGLQRQMCVSCGHHWPIIRVIPNFALDPDTPTPERVEATLPECCLETFDCVFDGPCYCACARCSEVNRCRIECTCTANGLDVWLSDDCPYHDENGNILNRITTCPPDCRCARCIGYREVDTR